MTDREDFAKKCEVWMQSDKSLTIKSCTNYRNLSLLGSRLEIYNN